VIDYSGKGNTGTAYSSTATSTSVLSTSTAMIGRAMSFDGVDDYILAANAITNDVITYSAWIKTSIATGDMVIDEGSHSSYANPLHGGITISSGKPRMYAGYISSAYRYTESPSSVADGFWHHIVGVSDNNGTYIYVDGQYKGTTSYKVSDATVTNMGTAIGKNYRHSNDPTFGGSFFNGLIDEVKIWNYARSAEQILQDYQRGLAGNP